MMDEMKLKLSTKFMRGIVAKLIAKAIYKKTGCKVNIQLNDLDISIIDGETSINTNVELKLNSNEFMKIMKSIDEE
jgi:hypothetical protein